MGTTYKEFKRMVMLRMQDADSGKTILAVEEGINQAQKIIAMVQDFTELMVEDKTNAKTVASTKSYHITTDLGLVRPKDLYTIRLMDTTNSRKLTYVPFQMLDRDVPYTEQVATGKSKWYTRRGMYIELFPIPDDAYDLYIMHSQWPTPLAADADETDFVNIDHVIVALGTDIANDILEGTNSDWMTKAQGYLGISIKEENYKPDTVLVAQPFNCGGGVRYSGEPWNDPFTKQTK